MNEGWYRDPFGVHQLRWFSAGTPTDLVRDEDVEAYEAPPQPTWDGDLVPYLPAPSADEEGGGDLIRSGEIPAQGDLLRADAAEAVPVDPTRAVAPADAALDRGATSGLGFS